MCICRNERHTTQQFTQQGASPPVKTRSIAITILGALALAALAHAQQMPPLPPPRPGFSFPLKQTLTYEVDWRVFTAGIAVVRFEADGARENLTASADTSGAINLIYHLSDRFQSSFDRAGGCTDDFNKQTDATHRLRPEALRPQRKEPRHRAQQAGGIARARLRH
jgi:hypothetical protein